MRVIDRLQEAGYVAYLAGGCVRDALLGKAPKDYDVATNATPDSVREVFGRRRTLAFGASFGVIGVLPPHRRVRDSDEPTVEPTEVATFRSDGTYSDGRRPDSVRYGNAEEDALRRDFTINGLFYDPTSKQMIDYVGGQSDLRAGLLRTIGDAVARFEEDKLRMLRAVRFATDLGFAVDPLTAEAVRQHAQDIKVVSGERIGAEMRRVLTAHRAGDGLKLLQEFELHHVVLPEIGGLNWDSCTAMLENLTERTFPAALACLLIAMPNSLQALETLAVRWKLSNEECRRTAAAISHWDTLVKAQSLPWSEVQPKLIDRDVAVMLEVARAIVAAEGRPSSGVDLASEALRWPAEKLDPPPLLTGDDLRELGVPAGPAYRKILKAIRDGQLDGKIRSREEAICRLPAS
ncbi:MAG: CCA tRNA nucleotidyltransferase [Pirellulales bacterium]|nr:CCA tRNA nucleotidyltransferase [Pirellulales bacterium]